MDACTDLNDPSMFVNPDDPLTKPYADMARRGVRKDSFQKLPKIIFITVKN